MPTNLLELISTYLKRINADIDYTVDEGICSGLVAWWLTCKANNNQQLWDDNINYILKYPVESTTERDLYMDTIIEALYLLQNNIYYLENSSHENITTALDIVKPNEVASPEFKTQVISTFTVDSLTNFLDNIPDSGLLRIATLKHAIATYKNNDTLSLYDPNESTKELISNNTTDIAEAIFKIFAAKDNISICITGYDTKDKRIDYVFPKVTYNTLLDLDALLHLAIIANDKPMIVNLIDGGIDLNSGKYGLPIQTAMDHYKIDLLEFLINKGATVDLEKNGYLISNAIKLNKLGYYGNKPTNLGFIILLILLESNIKKSNNFTKLVDILECINAEKFDKLGLLIAYGAKISNIQIDILSAKYKNTNTLWRLCKYIKSFSKELGKKPPDVYKKLLKKANYTLNLNADGFIQNVTEFLQSINTIQPARNTITINVGDQIYKGQTAINVLKQSITERLHNNEIKINDVWPLYNLLIPLLGWFKSDNLCEEVVNLIQNAKDNISKIEGTEIANNAKVIINVLKAMEYFAHINMYNLDTIKLRYCAKTNMHSLYKTLENKLDLKSIKDVNAFLIDSTAKKDAIRDKNNLIFSQENINVIENPHVNNICRLNL